MSEVKRYTDLQVWEALHFAGSTEGWIRWEDYARLKAELYDATGHYNGIINKLEAEVERLTSDNEQLQNRCDFLEGKPSA